MWHALLPCNPSSPHHQPLQPNTASHSTAKHHASLLSNISNYSDRNIQTMHPMWQASYDIFSVAYMATGILDSETKQQITYTNPKKHASRSLATISCSSIQTHSDVSSLVTLSVPTLGTDLPLHNIYFASTLEILLPVYDLPDVRQCLEGSTKLQLQGSNHISRIRLCEIKTSNYSSLKASAVQA